MSTLREVALRKDGHTYLFRADGESHRALLAVLWRFATNPELNFSWRDAAAVCKKFRQLSANRTSAVSAPATDRLRK
jgi:hypothetical protein